MMKKLREMFPNGMYTDNSEAVFYRFKELLKNDSLPSDEGVFRVYDYCGIDSDMGLELAQWDGNGYGINATYLTNEEFFDITLGDTKPKTENQPKPKVSILKALYENHKAAEEWLHRIPNEVSDAFFDTPYIDGLYKNNNILMKEVFGIYTDAAEWLLYEWREGLSCGIDGKMFDINSTEEYYQYLIDHEGWEE